MNATDTRWTCEHCGKSDKTLVHMCRAGVSLKPQRIRDRADAEKLEAVAAWFDEYDALYPEATRCRMEVQDDLRCIAKRLRGEA